MTKKEFMKLTGKSLPQANKLAIKKEFFIDGFGFFIVRRGRGKTSPLNFILQKGDDSSIDDSSIDDSSVGDSSVGDSSVGDSSQHNGRKKLTLEQQYKQAQINKINQQLSANIQKIRNEYKKEIIDCVIQGLKPIKRILKDLNLNEKKLKELKKIITETLNNL